MHAQQIGIAELLDEFDHLKRDLEAYSNEDLLLPIKSKARWNDFFEQLAVDLVNRYSEPHRFYHNCLHIAVGLRHLREADAGLVARLAYLFHDVIYVPGAPNGLNEILSAEYAMSVLHLILHLAPLTKLGTMIKATANHQIPDEYDDTSGDLALMLDVDLASLGWQPDEFQQNRDRLLNEFSELATMDGFEAQFAAGTAKFAESYLNRAQIYHTAEFRTKYETQARENLTTLLM